MKIRIRRRNPFHFTTSRQRLLLLAAAIGTAIALALALLLPHGQMLLARQALKRPPCESGRSAGCEPATVEVMLLAPSAAGASAPR